jgi:hypothetical protein
MNDKTRLVSICLAAVLGLELLFSSCGKTASPTTITLTSPVTQTVATTISSVSTTTVVSPTIVTATITQPAVTATTTVTGPAVTTTKTSPTVTQYYPPVTKSTGDAYDFFLPALTAGQTVNFTLNLDGASLNYFVRDPTFAVIQTVNIPAGTKTSSGTFKAALSGTYTIECVATEGQVVFTLFFSIS